MTDTYNQIRKQECQWCAKGMRISRDPGSGRDIHVTHVDYDPAGNTEEYESCTAPTKDAVIDRLASALERARKAIEDAPCSYHCNTRKPHGGVLMNKPNPAPVCNCWKRDALAALESKEQTDAK